MVAEAVFIDAPEFFVFETMCNEAREVISAEELQKHNRIVGVGRMDDLRFHVDLCVDVDRSRAILGQT